MTKHTSNNSGLLRPPSFRWQIHLIYWTIVIITWPLISFITEGELWEPIVNKLGYLPSQILVTYIFLYALLPILYRSQYLQFALAGIATIYVSTVLARGMKIYFYEPLTGYDSPQESIIEILTQKDPLLIQYLIWVLMVPAFTIILVLVYQHFNQQRLLAALETRRSQSELGFLRGQLHPHFLFNTINNLYTLSVQGSDQTSDVAKRLRNILAFMFEKRDAQLIPLSEEIDLVKNYVELEKLRYGDRLDFNMEVDVPPDKYGVIPFIFLSLVENAFKHGASKDLGHPYIHITLDEDKGRLRFIIENSVAVHRGTDVLGDTHGIGLDNIKRQLELLYPGTHRYDVKADREKYRVEVVIDKVASPFTKSNIHSSQLS